MEEMTFEQALHRVEQSVHDLETGDAPLEESMKLYEEAAALVRMCTVTLESAKQKIVKLKKGEDGAPAEEPFDRENELDD